MRYEHPRLGFSIDYDEQSEALRCRRGFARAADGVCSAGSCGSPS
jgi:hypothetical protein